MKASKSIFRNLLLMVVIAAVYRVFPGRPYGFAPQIAIALFGGAVIRNRFWAFALPLLSMFLSDALYQVLYSQGLSVIPGFYQDQWMNYLAYASVVLVGFFMKKINTRSVLGYSLIAATWFFLISNFMVWASGTGLLFPHTWSGLMGTYSVALPFYGWSIAATLVFASVLFGLHSQLAPSKRSGPTAALAD